MAYQRKEPPDLQLTIHRGQYVSFSLQLAALTDRVPLLDAGVVVLGQVFWGLVAFRWLARAVAIVAGVLVLGSANLHAQGVATQAVNLTATVDDYLLIDSSPAGITRAATVAVNGGVVTPGSITVSGSQSSVISTSNVRLQLKSVSGGLTNASPQTGAPFANKVHYTASATYNDVTEVLDTSTATPGVPTSGKVIAAAKTSQPLQLSVNVAGMPPGKYLSSGDFNDTLIVTLTPVP